MMSSDSMDHLQELCLLWGALLIMVQEGGDVVTASLSVQHQSISNVHQGAPRHKENKLRHQGGAKRHRHLHNHHRDYSSHPIKHPHYLDPPSIIYNNPYISQDYPAHVSQTDPDKGDNLQGVSSNSENQRLSLTVKDTKLRGKLKQPSKHQTRNEVVKKGQDLNIANITRQDREKLHQQNTNATCTEHQSKYTNNSRHDLKNVSGWDEKRQVQVLSPLSEKYIQVLPKSRDQSNQVVRRKHPSGRSKIVRKRPMRLMGHFHIPHFGMIDGTHYQRRPAVKGAHSVEGTFLWAVGLFGTVENGAIVLTAIFSKKFKRPLHLLVGSLAATDLFISLIYIPSYTYFLLEGDRNLADKTYRVGSESPFTFCQISRSIFVEIASVTLTIKALISIYLYVLTCSRNWARHLFSTRNTFLFIFFAWLLNFCIMFMPTFLGYSKVDFYPNAFVCSKGQYITTPHWGEHELGTIYSFSALSVHITELLVIMICFVQVYRAILKGRTYCETHREKDREAKINYIRATKITILVFVSFIICWLPIYIVNIVDPDHSKLPDDVHHLVMDLLLLKSSINPSIYIYGIRSLRFEMKLLCMCRCRADVATAKAVLAKPPDSSSADVNSMETSSAGV